MLNHKLSETDTKKPNQGNWQVIGMSNLVHIMLIDMKEIFEQNNSDLSCSEQVSFFVTFFYICTLILKTSFSKGHRFNGR